MADQVAEAVVVVVVVAEGVGSRNLTSALLHHSLRESQNRNLVAA